MKFEWERLPDTTTARAKIFGGWLVSNNPRYSTHPLREDAIPFGTSMVFVHDPHHEWSVDE